MGAQKPDVIELRPLGPFFSLKDGRRNGSFLGSFLRGCSLSKDIPFQSIFAVIFFIDIDTNAIAIHCVQPYLMRVMGILTLSNFQPRIPSPLRPLLGLPLPPEPLREEGAGTAQDVAPALPPPLALIRRRHQTDPRQGHNSKENVLA